MRYSICALFILIHGLSCVSAQVMHAPKGIRKVMEKSSLNYQWNEQPVKIQLDLKQNNPFTAVVAGEKGPVPVLQKIPEECTILIAQGDSLHNLGYFEQAISAYRKASLNCAEFSYPEMLQAQEWLILGEQDSAIAVGKRAVAKNYYDYTAHWILAAAYFNAGDSQHSLREITLAKLLNIHLQEIQEVLVPFYAESGLEVNAFTFLPAYRISKSEKGISIICGEKWLNYAAVMALWKYEPEYRKAMMKEKNGDIPASMLQFKEGILNLMMGLEEESGAKFRDDADFKAMQYAVKAGFVHEFIFAEILLPEEPSLIYQQTPEMIEKLADYWLKVHVQ